MNQATRERASLVGFGVAACAACCAAPILSIVAAAAIATTLAYLAVGVVALVALIPLGIWILRRQRIARHCEPADAPAPVPVSLTTRGPG